MNNNQEIVFIIDDDQSVRNSLQLFLISVGYQVESFGSSEDFLSREVHDGPGCLILDVNLSGKTGIELQEELIKINSLLPIIFISGHGNILMSVKALKRGAVNFLEKPFSEDELLQSIEEALKLSQKLSSEKEEKQKARELLQTLTPRETEILKYVITGMLNKQIASELQIAEQTVKLHRQKICEKLGIRSVPEMIRIAEKA
jgi:two-component system response regulator FixJ